MRTYQEGSRWLLEVVMSPDHLCGWQHGGPEPHPSITGGIPPADYAYPCLFWCKALAEGPTGNQPYTSLHT